MRVLVVVDMQNDFITGPLGSEEAVAARDNLCQWMRDNLSSIDKVIFTQDIHGEDYLNTQEGRNLPIPHCIENSDGCGIDISLLSAVLTHESEPHTIVVKKSTFGVIDLKRYMPMNISSADEIIFCGLCTDICLVSNILIMKAQEPEIPIRVLANCCAGTTPENHKAALQVMKSCQVIVEGE